MTLVLSRGREPAPAPAPAPVQMHPARRQAPAFDAQRFFALLPGATDTDFFRRAGMLDTPLARLPVKDDPAHVAKQGYDALLRGDAKVVASSPISKATGAVARLLPDSVKAVANRLLVTPFGPR